MKKFLAALMMVGLLVSAVASVASAMPASQTTYTGESSFAGGNG